MRRVIKKKVKRVPARKKSFYQKNQELVTIVFSIAIGMMIMYLLMI